MFDEDCINGTVYMKKAANLTQCEQACSDDDQCDAFVMPDGLNVSHCHLCKQPIINWDRGAEKSNCRAGMKNINSLNVPSDNCACYQFYHVAVGWQSQGNQGGGIPGMPCTAATTNQKCDNMDHCGWQSEGNCPRHDHNCKGACYEFTCANHTRWVFSHALLI